MEATILILFCSVVSEMGTFVQARVGNQDGGTYNPRSAWKFAHQRRRILPDIDIKSHFQSVETHIWEDIQNYHKLKSSQDRQGLLPDYSNTQDYDYLEDEYYSTYEEETPIISKHTINHSPEYRESIPINQKPTKKYNTDNHSNKSKYSTHASVHKDTPLALKYTDSKETSPWKDELRFQKTYWQSFNTDIDDNKNTEEDNIIQDTKSKSKRKENYTNRMDRNREGIVTGKKRSKTANTRFVTAPPIPTNTLPTDQTDWNLNAIRSDTNVDDWKYSEDDIFEKGPSRFRSVIKKADEKNNKKWNGEEDFDIGNAWDDHPRKGYKSYFTSRESERTKMIKPDEITERSNLPRIKIARGKQYPYETKLPPPNKYLYYDEEFKNNEIDESYYNLEENTSTTETVINKERRKLIQGERRKPDISQQNVISFAETPSVVKLKPGQPGQPGQPGHQVSSYYEDGYRNYQGPNQVVNYVAQGVHKPRVGVDRQLGVQRPRVGVDRQLVQVRPVTGVATTATTQRNTDVNASAVALLSFLLLLNMMQDVMERIAGRR